MMNLVSAAPGESVDSPPEPPDMNGPSRVQPTASLDTLLPALREHFILTATRERWGRTMIALGWLHLAFFGVCQAIYDWPAHRPWQHVALWFVEVVAILVLLRKMNGRLWFQKTPLAGVVVRIWSTFLIIAFNSATLNAMTGFSVDWFKLSWTALSTFGFASTAWLLGPKFLIPAVQMYFTGLIVAKYPQWAFAIYGVSWWAALLGIGVYAERLPRERAAESKPNPSPRRSRTPGVEREVSPAAS